MKILLIFFVVAKENPIKFNIIGHDETCIYININRITHSVDFISGFMLLSVNISQEGKFNFQVG